MHNDEKLTAFFMTNLHDITSYKVVESLTLTLAYTLTKGKVL